MKGSLKTSTRESRGSGGRRKVLPSVALPRNWQEFLRVDDNKTELFHMLSRDVTKVPTDKEIVSNQIVSILEVSRTECSHGNAFPL